MSGDVLTDTTFSPSAVLKMRTPIEARETIADLIHRHADH